MGFYLMTNFKRPYFSKSISEFWSRWHISLSTWFRDYLYIPLGGNRVGLARWYFNLFFVFVVSGLWHGANWTFIIWGGLNGLYLILALVTKEWGKGISKNAGGFRDSWANTIFQIITTFLLCCFAWIFFRANSVSDSFLIVKKIFLERGSLFIPEDRSVFIYGFLGLLILFLVEVRQEFLANRFSFLFNQNTLVRFFSMIAIIVSILLLGVFDGGQFIYFQF